MHTTEQINRSRTDPQTGKPETRAFDVFDSVEEACQALIDVFDRFVATSNVQEAIKQEVSAIKLADHRRRLEAEGKHPLTGETPEQYRATLERYNTHPITGDQLPDYNERQQRESVKQSLRGRKEEG
jgi:hypothetical protein